MIGKRKQANLHHPPPKTLLELVALSPWQLPARPGRGELLSWRTTLALALSDVPLKPVAEHLWPILVEMADQVGVRLTAEVVEGRTDPEGASFARWLENWREQFQHWHDPLRELVFQQVRGEPAEYLIGHLAEADGFAVADFVLSCVVAEERRIRFAARMRDEPPPPQLLPHWVAGAVDDHRPAMSRAVTYLFSRFQHTAPFRTGPAPADPVGWAEVAHIYPAASLTAEPFEARQETLP